MCNTPSGPQIRRLLKTKVGFYVIIFPLKSILWSSTSYALCAWHCCTIRHFFGCVCVCMVICEYVCAHTVTHIALVSLHLNVIGYELEVFKGTGGSMWQGAVFLKIQWIDLQRSIFTCRRRKLGLNSVYLLVSLPLSTSLTVCCISRASSVMFSPQRKKKATNKLLLCVSVQLRQPVQQLSSHLYS